MDERWMRPLVVPWLTQQIVDDVRPLWELQLSPDELREVDDLVSSEAAGWQVSAESRLRADGRARKGRAKDRRRRGSRER
jgi:hypothetical protein